MPTDIKIGWIGAHRGRGGLSRRSRSAASCRPSVDARQWPIPTTVVRAVRDLPCTIVALAPNLKGARSGRSRQGAQADHDPGQYERRP